MNDDRISKHIEFKDSLKAYKEYLSKLNNIDWNRTNLKDWENRVIAPNGRIVKSSRYIRLTCNLIKQKLDLPLTKDEQKLENEFNNLKG